MKSVKPNELFPHRVFFTEFDRYNSMNLWHNQKDEISNLIERRIKLLILTKGHIVIAASQLLESPFAHRLIIKNPELLTSGALISSMKVGNETTNDFLEEKRHEKKKSKINPYHTSLAKDVADIIDSSGTAVRWKITGMSDWFRDRLASDIDDPKSLLRVTLAHESVIVPKNLSNKIKKEDVLRRGTVESILKKYNDPKLENIFLAYTDFIYYLSGARTTNSEGILPQENLVDFSIGDLLEKKTKLTDIEVFFKVFIDTVKAKTSTIFPTDFLDAIDIKDAIELRHIAIEKSFIDKYNSIQLKTKQALNTNDPERLVLLLEELQQFETELFNEFSKNLDNELPTRIKEEKKRALGKVLHSMASLFIPGYSPDSYKDMIVSGLKIAGKNQAALSIENKVNQGLYACETMLEKSNLLEHQVLLDYVDELKKKYVSKL